MVESGNGCVESANPGEVIALDLWTALIRTRAGGRCLCLQRGEADPCLAICCRWSGCGTRLTCGQSRPWSDAVFFIRVLKQKVATALPKGKVSGERENICPRLFRFQHKKQPFVEKNCLNLTSAPRQTPLAEIQNISRFGVSIESQNHSMVGVGRALCGSPSPTPAQAGSPRAGCTALRPGRAGISPEKETPQPPWAAWARAPSPSE